MACLLRTNKDRFHRMPSPFLDPGNCDALFRCRIFGHRWELHRGDTGCTFHLRCGRTYCYAHTPCWHDDDLCADLRYEEACRAKAITERAMQVAPDDITKGWIRISPELLSERMRAVLERALADIRSEAEAEPR